MESNLKQVVRFQPALHLCCCSCWRWLPNSTKYSYLDFYLLSTYKSKRHSRVICCFCWCLQANHLLLLCLRWPPQQIRFAYGGHRSLSLTPTKQFLPAMPTVSTMSTIPILPTMHSLPTLPTMPTTHALPTGHMDPFDTFSTWQARHQQLLSHLSSDFPLGWEQKQCMFFLAVGGLFFVLRWPSPGSRPTACQVFFSPQWHTLSTANSGIQNSMARHRWYG